MWSAGRCHRGVKAFAPAPVSREPTLIWPISFFVGRLEVGCSSAAKESRAACRASNERMFAVGNRDSEWHGHELPI
jgi:hypothetical protein